MAAVEAPGKGVDISEAPCALSELILRMRFGRMRGPQLIDLILFF